MTLTAESSKREADTMAAWVALDRRPRFIQLMWTGTLFGLKNDGTIWKCTSPGANPLVWTLVSQ